MLISIMVSNRRIVGAFILLFTVVYILYVNALNFPFNYKVILYLPAFIMFSLFLLVSMGKGKTDDEEKSVSDYFSFGS